MGGCGGLSWPGHGVARTRPGTVMADSVTSHPRQLEAGGPRPGSDPPEAGRGIHRMIHADSDSVAARATPSQLPHASSPRRISVSVKTASTTAQKIRGKRRGYLT